MKALFSLTSAKHQGSAIAIMALIAVAPLVFPGGFVRAETFNPQTAGQSALVFQIKDPAVLQPQSQTTTNSLTYQQVIQQDPLSDKLKDYLTAKNSPFADYTDTLLTYGNWKEMLSISFVESNMGQHCYYYNCSGIGGQEYLRKYPGYEAWMKDMSELLNDHYQGWSFAKMDGIYVQPYSPNWKYGAEKTFAELTDLETQAQAEKLSLQTNSQLALANSQTAAITR